MKRLVSCQLPGYGFASSRGRTASLVAWLALGSLTTAVLGCSTTGRTATPVRSSPQDEARALAQSLTRLPFVLRYNPAPCVCPAFEVRTTGPWLRTELDVTGLPDGPAWLDALAQVPLERLPVPVDVAAEPDGELYRTWSGTWSTRLVVQAIRGPLVGSMPVPAPAPVPAPTPAPATTPSNSP